MKDLGLSRWCDVKDPPTNQEVQGTQSLIPELRGSWVGNCSTGSPVFLPGKGHGQRGSWWATAHGITEESDTS